MKIKTRLYYLLRNNFVYKDWAEYYKKTFGLANNKVIHSLLNDLLIHARENVPFYSRRIPYKSDLQNFLHEIPILRRETIEKNLEQLKSIDFSQRPHFLNSSSGSTAQPIQFYQDQEYNQWLLATENYYYQKFLGIDYADTKKVIIWGSARDLKTSSTLKSKVGQFLSSTYYLNSFDDSPHIWKNFVDRINHIKPDLIKSYASSLFLLAKQIKEKNLKCHRPKYLITSAETLKPYMRETIEEVFQQNVQDYYGSRELGIIAAQCTKGKMHTFPFFNYVEIADSKGEPVKPGEDGIILITNLRNFSMPFIRYQLGDTAIMGDHCLCGEATPVLEKVTGRIADHFLAHDGSQVHGLFFSRMFFFKKWVAEFQLLQKEIDLIEIHFVPKELPSSSDKEEINRKIRERMGEQCRIHWVEKEKIHRTREGKWLVTKNLINKEKTPVS